MQRLAFTLLNFGRAGVCRFLITSSWPQEGKTTVCGNLAAALASLGRRVLLVDYNAADGALTARVGSPEQAESGRPGPCRLEGVDLLRLAYGTSATGGLDLVTRSGRSGLAEVFRSYDVVLVDSQALSVSRECLNAAGLVDGSLMVVSQRQFKGVVEGNHSEDLRDFGIPVLGVVVSG